MVEALLTIQTVIWLMVVVMFLRSPRGSMFHPFAFYLAFHGIVFVLRPIMERAFNFDLVFYAMRFYPSEEDMVRAILVSLLAFLVFTYACLGIDRTAPRFDRRFTVGFNRQEWRAFMALCILVLPIALYSAYLNIHQDDLTASGNEEIGMQRDEETGIATFTNTTGYVVDAEKMLGTLALMFIWGMRFRLISFVPFAVYIAERVYVGWSRWTIIMAFASLALLYLFKTGRRWFPLRVVVVAIPIFLVFHQLGQDRGYYQALFLGGTLPQEDPIEKEKTWIQKQDTPDFANLDFLTFVMDVVPEKSGTYTYFTQYLQLFTEPIPRILWAGKPFGPPIQWVNLNDYGNWIGWTLSLVGDGWMSGGWLGVIVTMLVVGYANARAHRWFWRGEATHFKLLCYTSYVPLTLQWYRDGGITIFKFALMAVMPVILWRGLVRIIGRSSEPGTSFQPGYGRPLAGPGGGRVIGPPAQRL
ncbi:MAG TPA: hypothetical protein VMC10_19070 [Stellaceae bacterium]|nr:hypothetical protein [Stellaceae bacterium]